MRMLRRLSEIRLELDFMDSELASELYCDEVLAGDGRILHLDAIRSVSAMPEAEAAARSVMRDQLFLPQGSS